MQGKPGDQTPLTAAQQEVLGKLRQAREIVSMLRLEPVGETIVWFADKEELPFAATMQLVELGYLVSSKQKRCAPYAELWCLAERKEE